LIENCQHRQKLHLRGLVITATKCHRPTNQSVTQIYSKTLCIGLLLIWSILYNSSLLLHAIQYKQTWKTVTIAHRSESKFFRSQWHIPADISSQLHWCLSCITQNLPPNRFMPSILHENTRGLLVSFHRIRSANLA